MALKGQNRRFAEAIIAAKPLKISNREAALAIGCSESSASAAGSRCARNPEVRAYIEAHWPDYYGSGGGKAAPMVQVATQQTALPLFCGADVAAWLADEAGETDLNHVAAALIERGALSAAAIKAWVQQADAENAEFKEIVQAVCLKLGATTDPMNFWDSVLISPYSTAKEKGEAAREKAKYTMSKPAAANKKESALETARNLRAARQNNSLSLFSEQDETEPTSLMIPQYKGTVPKWN